MGDQSHGKSSVMEALSGVDLPRGEGIKTRVPLVIMLKQATADGEYAEIQCETGSKRIELADVAEAIDARTIELAGDAKNIRDSPVELTVYRVGQDDLTLVDLPGMTRVALNGQDASIATTIQRMYRRYIAPEETIVLNVVSAMVDISTSEALQLSRELDTSGDRTLLCITKVDQHVEPGLPAKVLRASEQLNIPMSRIFCVRNRSQQENEALLPLAAVREAERRFFAASDEFHDLPTRSVGAAHLSQHLVQTQVERIRSTLPANARKIADRIKELEAEQIDIGDFPQTDAECHAKIHPLLTRVTHQLSRQYTGRTETRAGVTTHPNQVLELVTTVPAKSLQTAGHRHEGAPTLVTGAGSTTVCLTLFAGGQKDKDKINTNGTLEVKLDPTVESVTLVYQFSNSAGGITPLIDSTFAKGRGAKTKEILKASDLHKLVSQNQAGTFTVDIFIADIQFTTPEVMNAQPIRNLCTRLPPLDQQFENDMYALYPKDAFTSLRFRYQIEAELASRRGAHGLPGSIVPEVPLAVLATMRERIPAIHTAYIDAMAAATRSSFVAAVQQPLDPYPGMQAVIITEVHRLCDEQTALAHATMAEMMKWEGTVHSSNHYFMQTVNKIKVREDGGWDTSNETEKVGDLQIELYAYWKLMLKRLVDYTELAARWTLIADPIDNLLLPRLQTVVEAAATSPEGLLDAMAARKHTQLRHDHVVARLAQLHKANAAVVDAQRVVQRHS